MRAKFHQSAAAASAGWGLQVVVLCWRWLSWMQPPCKRTFCVCAGPAAGQLLLLVGRLPGRSVCGDNLSNSNTWANGVETWENSHFPGAGAAANAIWPGWEQSRTWSRKFCAKLEHFSVRAPLMFLSTLLLLLFSDLYQFETCLPCLVAPPSLSLFFLFIFI